MFGLGTALKEILSRLVNPFNLKVLDLYLEMWLWSPLICVKKAVHGGLDIWDYVRTYTFNNFVDFYPLLGFFIINVIIILLFLFVYISLLPLFSLLKLIFSSFLPLVFITTIY